MRDWNSKKNRRDAVTKFLQKTVSDPEFRALVSRDRQAAHQALKKEGDIDLPDDVEVICVGPSTQERDKLIVIVLPSRRNGDRKSGSL